MEKQSAQNMLNTDDRKYNIPDRVRREIIEYARKNNIEKVTLFGSRAMGTHTPRSDIDIAVSGGHFDEFYWDLKENVHSLLSFDIVDMDSGVSKELTEEIKGKGVVVYEKA